ncbi:MAG: fibronectin type III domain-containing protein, partial [Saprospiraceae bacterium]|nr:fibronectin type III domain-containing protein [Saprospiraceae bacterium]
DTTVSGSVTLIWPDAEDSVGVEKYKIYKDNVLVKTLDGDANSYTLSGLTVDKEYVFVIRAIDDAGNTSANLSVTYLAK